MPERSSQLGDQRQDVHEHFPRHGDLGHSKVDVTPFVRDAAKRSGQWRQRGVRHRLPLIILVRHLSPAMMISGNERPALGSNSITCSPAAGAEIGKAAPLYE